MKILDYGCGPYSISAAPKASEIILADYAEPNREYLKRWLTKDPSAQDWSPYFKYVVQTLEGGSEQDAIKREEMLCSKIRAVAECDIEKEAFIEDAYNKSETYDVVKACRSQCAGNFINNRIRSHSQEKTSTQRFESASLCGPDQSNCFL